MAGLNAARRAQGLEPVAFPRTGSYIGTLIDDLVTKARCCALFSQRLGCRLLRVHIIVCNPAFSMLLFTSSAHRQLNMLVPHIHVCALQSWSGEYACEPDAQHTRFFV